MAYPYLDHANHVGLTHARVGDELRLTVTQQTGKMPVGGTIGQIIKKQSATDYDAAWENEAAAVLEAVEGGAGFAPVSGIVSLNVAPARAFHHEMVGNITQLSFANVPDANAFAATWSWVLRINATGNYTLSGMPTVTFVDGRSFADTNLAANAVNIFTFWRVGAITYAALVTNGKLAFDPYKACFLANETLSIPTEDEKLNFTEATKIGTGTIAYRKSGSGTNLSGEVTFALGDTLDIVCTGISGRVSVRVPRYAL